MLLKPAKKPFLSSKEWEKGKEINQDSTLICGIPYEKTESFRAGASLAPDAIRDFSHSLESFSIILEKDLEEIQLLDMGNLEVTDLEPSDMTNEVENFVESHNCKFLLLLGGEHTITLGAIKGLIKRFPDLHFVSLDSHPDFRQSYEGRELCHATVMKRIADIIGLERMVFLGLRTATPQEWKELKKALLLSPSPAPLPSYLKGKPIYLSIDIDVLDPSCAPGTGNPEPGGWSFKELLDFVLSLRGYNIVGMDIVEVSPPLDPSGITAVSSAKIAREAILLFS
ncbi:agmatinase [bacterium]|nr:agmatinase [bacterium]